MCNPAIIVGGLMAVSGAYSANAQYQQGLAQSRMYEYQAEVNRQEAAAALKRGESQSNLIQESSKAEGRKQKMGAAEVSAAQKAALAANGIDLGSGTAQDISLNTFNKSKMDELGIRYNADVKSWSAQTDASYQNWSSLNSATQNQFAAKNAKVAGKQQAIGTLLGTASQIGQTFFVPK